MENRIDNIIVKDAKIIWRNFAGRGTEYNREGDRNCTLVIEDPEDAERIRADGWNVRIKPAREEGENPRCTLKVNVKFGRVPPKVVLIAHGKHILLTEEDVGILDKAEWKKCDVAIRPYEWEVGGKSGVAAYLKTLYVTQEEDEFERDYLDDEDIPFEN